MNEGWHENQHFIVFDAEESRAATERYGLSAVLPEYEIVGLLGWDDFIVRNVSGQLFTVPTVPLVAKYLKPLPGDLPTELQSNVRAGTIKWYIKPVVFGGSPEIGENVAWVDHSQHAKLVRWWNEQYDVAVRMQKPMG